MITVAIKHIEKQGQILVSRILGNANGKIKVVRKSYDILKQYTVSEQNGNTPQTYQAKFPSDKYSALNYTPIWQHHRFCGWYKIILQPTQYVPQSETISPNDKIDYNINNIYAGWQLPANITFDATTGGGQMPSGWTSPDYYINQTFSVLPKPTHPTLNFGGWFDANNNRIKEESLVTGNIKLTAKYVAQSYEVDLNNQWRLSTSQSNPNASLYDGVYESNSNYNIANAYSKMYIRINGYDEFSLYIRSYAESNYDYTLAFNPDIDISSNPSYTTSGVKTHTRGKQQSGQAINNYLKVTYTGLNGGEHYIIVVYRKDTSVNSGNDRGYLLIPKEQ